MSKSLKVGIVGGGLAGLLAARFIKLNYPDAEIDVFEKRNEDKYRVDCAEALINQRNSFKLAGEIAKPHVTNRLRKVRWELESAEGVVVSRIHYTSEFCWMVNRMAWQKQLINELSSMGVRIHFGVRMNPESLEEYDVCVDARGSIRGEYCGVGVYKVLKGEFSQIKDTNVCRMSEDEPGVLYWIFPLDENTANIGCGGDKVRMKNLNEYIEALADKLEIEGEVRRGAGLLDYSYAALLYYGKEKIVAENLDDGRTLFRIGDAAGLVDPFTGEGMTGAIQSAYLLAASLRDMDRCVEVYAKSLLRENKFLVRSMEASLARKVNFRAFVRFMELIDGVNGKYLGSKMFPIRYPIRFLKMLRM